MIKTYLLLFSLLVLMSFATLLQAQKPTDPQSFEINTAIQEDFFWNNNMRVSATTGFPLAIYNPDFPVLGDSPEAKALYYLTENKAVLGLTDEVMEQMEVYAVRESPGGTTVRFRQYNQNLPVSKSDLAVTIDPGDRVCFVANNFSYDLTPYNNNPTIIAQEAEQLFTDYVGFTGNVEVIKNNLEVFHQQGLSHLIYRIVLAAENPLGEWEAYIDAHSGELLKVKDLSCYYKDHKEAIAPGLPFVYSIFVTTGTGNVFDPDPLSSAHATYGDTGFTDNSDNTSTQLAGELTSKTLLDITFSGGNYQLIGPYAEIQDFESPLRGLFAQSSSTWDYNRTDDAFEAVNTYYHIDASMRYINETLGLSIMPSAYTGGVRFDPHGLNGADNSHYLGGSQRVSFGEGGVDDAEDSDVIHHELGHGLHDWVTNGNLSQVNGLSEGSGDYWAVSYNRSLGLWASNEAPYNWVFNWDGHNPFWNGRVVNYPNTYPGGLVGQVHTDGQIWSTCMMKIWDDIGKSNTDVIFWDGLGMTTSNSSQDDAANAVYQAALNLNYSFAFLSDIHDRMTMTGYNLPALPLPVELVEFGAIRDGEVIRLYWHTASETNNDYFSVERSVNGVDYESIGKVRAKDGNSAAIQVYDFTDVRPERGINYYRLKQTDLDGTFSYTEVVTVLFEDGPLIQLYPNPVVNTLFLEAQEQIDIISMYDVTGQLFDLPVKVETKRQEINVTKLPAGIYTLKLQTKQGIKMRKFFKQ